MSTVPATAVASLKSLFWRQSHAATDAPITATELQRRYLPVVYSYVSARLPCVADAEDVCAEVFAAAFAGLRSAPTRPGTATDDPLRAWLFGIARRKIADVYRKRARKPEGSADSLPPQPFANAPESGVLADEAARTLQAILATLPELQSEALRLKYVEELSLAEIGVVLQKSPNAVSQLLFRARQTVRQRGATYFSDPDTEETNP